MEFTLWCLQVRKCVHSFVIRNKATHSKLPVSCWENVMPHIGQLWHWNMYVTALTVLSCFFRGVQQWVRGYDCVCWWNWQNVWYLQGCEACCPRKNIVCLLTDNSPHVGHWTKAGMGIKSWTFLKDGKPAFKKPTPSKNGWLIDIYAAQHVWRMLKGAGCCKRSSPVALRAVWTRYCRGDVPRYRYGDVPRCGVPAMLPPRWLVTNWCPNQPTKGLTRAWDSSKKQVDVPLSV